MDPRDSVGADRAGRRRLRATAGALAALVIGCPTSPRRPTAEAALNPITLFEPPRPLNVGAGESALFAGDIDGDGDCDLVVAEEAQGRVLVLSNDGSGGLSEPSAYQAGPLPSWIAGHDLNGDGVLDLVVANHERRFLTVLRGGPPGTFTASVSIPLASLPHSHMADAADFNRDGRLDLIVDSRDRFGIYILEARSNGRFGAPGIGVSVGGRPYLGFAVDDLNGDEWPDIITPNHTGLAILWNRSSAGFELGEAIDVATPFAVRTGDFNRDGHPDLVAASESGEPGLTILTGDSSGRFTKRATVGMRAGAKNVVVGDFDGDGAQDIAASSWNADLVVVRGGLRQVDVTRPSLADLRSPWGLAACDLNGDGRSELVVADAGQALVYIYWAQRVEPANKPEAKPPGRSRSTSN